MQNPDGWTPTKFVMSSRGLRATLDQRYVRVGSRLVVNLIAARYGPLLATHARGVLADLGCGNVPLYAAYRALVDEVICVDWQNSPHAINHVDHVCDLNGPVPLDAMCVDTVVMSDVIEHIARPWVLWSEVARVLKPGGKVVGNVPFLYWVHEAPHDYHRYTSFGLQRYASDNGLHVVCIEPYGGIFEVLADFFGKLLTRIPLVGKLSARLLASAAFSWSCSSIGRRAMATSAALFPAGYMFVMQRKVPSVVGQMERES